MTTFRWLITALGCLYASALDYTYNENLEFYSINNGSLLAVFKFKQTKQTSALPIAVSDYGSFPPTIQDIVLDYGLQSGKISFGRGRWDQSNWGQAPFPVASTGIGCRAQFKENGEDVDSRWIALTHRLSGLLCGSIGLLNDALTTAPSTNERFGILPGEAVCTENLTPWLKLLPCMSNAGIGSLINPVKIYEARYSLMELSIEARPSHADPSMLDIELNHALAVVFELEKWAGSTDWSLRTLFDRIIEKKCPIGSASVDIGVMQYADDAIIDRDLSSDDSSQHAFLNPARLVAERFLVGKGQETGQVLTRLENKSDASLSVKVYEIIPWYMKLYMHTYQSSIKLASFRYGPAVDRVKPAQLEWSIVVPPKSTVTMTVEFDMALLRTSEYNMSPARGFDIPGALIQYSEDGKVYDELVTGTMLLTLMTPDFTMPFNVIMLTTLIMTFFYGVFFNFCFRRFYLPSEGKPLRPIQRLKQRIMRLVSRKQD